MADIEVNKLQSAVDTDQVPTRKREKLSIEKLRRGQVDRRLKEFRDASRLREQIFEDLGGEGGLSETQKILVDRIAFKLIIVRTIELGVLSGQEDIFKGADRYYLALVNSLRRDLSTIGFRRVKRAASLQDYLGQKKVEIVD